jgi:hypothetical protein
MNEKKTETKKTDKRKQLKLENQKLEDIDAPLMKMNGGCEYRGTW